jgi:MoxR-like ATPase
MSDITLPDADDFTAEPYYLPQRDEIEVFEAAYQARLPVLLKGPTGCGKTRFVEHMAWRIYRRDESHRLKLATPLITVSCHEDLTGTDLVGRFLLRGDDTIWMDGPLTRAVRTGAVCYLDEVVEARKDTTVIIHSLTDHRRMLPIDKTAELLHAHPDFLLVISYNHNNLPVFPLRGFTTSAYEQFLANDELKSSIVTSAQIAALSPTLVGFGNQANSKQICKSSRIHRIGDHLGIANGFKHFGMSQL